MPIDVVEEARLRLARLKTEVLQLEAFIEIGEQIASGRPGPIGSDALRTSPPPARRTRTKQAGAPMKDVVKALENMIRAASAPIAVETLLRDLGAAGLVITAKDPRKNLATILWRNRDVFEHVLGEGYRWIGPAKDK